jgi:hypothetical protein
MQWRGPRISTSDADEARIPSKGRAMLTYTATDLVELIRRDMDAAAASARIHHASTPGLLRQVRQWLAAERSAQRQHASRIG